MCWTVAGYWLVGNTRYRYLLYLIPPYALLVLINTNLSVMSNDPISFAFLESYRDVLSRQPLHRNINGLHRN